MRCLSKIMVALTTGGLLLLCACVSTQSSGPAAVQSRPTAATPPATEKSGPEVFLQFGHDKQVNAVAVSSDGRYALSGSLDTTMKLWDLDSGREIRTFRGHTMQVNAVGFSPDGRTAISGSWDTTLKYWDIATGDEIRTLQGYSDNVLKVFFDPDGLLAFSQRKDNRIRVWDMETGQMIGILNALPYAVEQMVPPPGGRTGIDDRKARAIKTAMEGYKGHGVFTFALLDALEKADHLFGNKDRQVSIFEIAAYIDEHVPALTYEKWGYEQIPQVNMQGRDFPVAITP